MMVAVEAMSEANISVSGSEPNSSAGARTLTNRMAKGTSAWLNRPLIIPKNAIPT